jgi:hypothetical protein
MSRTNEETSGLPGVPLEFRLIYLSYNLRMPNTVANEKKFSDIHTSACMQAAGD